jgi:TonB family protein
VNAAAVDRRVIRASAAPLPGTQRTAQIRAMTTVRAALPVLLIVAAPIAEAQRPDTTTVRPDTVYDASGVDRQVRVDPARVTVPEYPAELHMLGRSGQVLAEFVVDTLGAAEMETFRADSSSDPLFTEAVRTAVAASRYVPAMLHGHLVRQRARQPFLFNADTARAVVRVTYERDAQLLPESPVAEYPPELLRAGVEAVVSTRFVVDTTGRADESTFQFAEVRVFRRVDMGTVPMSEGAQRMAFEEAVRAVIPKLRFEPAVSGGVKARQSVRMPFTFLVPMQ